MINRLLQFLDASPVNFLAVRNIVAELEQSGYTRFDASESLTDIQPGSKFFVTKNDSSVYAFRIGSKPLAEAGFRMICAHCDSPTFRIKPNAEMLCEGGIVKLNTEVYGGPIMSTWFDRPLTLAGRVITRGDSPMEPRTLLMHVRRPLLQISNLAIHFNRQVNDGVKLSRQKDMLPLLGMVTDELEKGNMLIGVICDELGISKEEILDFDLYLADATPACLFGVHDEFISSGRLDDLSMCYAGLEALTGTPDGEVTSILAIFDNEETGSQTKQGAGSPFLSSLLRRIALAQGGGEEAYWRSVEKAFMVSADNAHAWHPNYDGKYDPTNHAVMGGGPVIKINANCKYMSDSRGAAVFNELCREAGVKAQYFVNHSDSAGGSTLGNIATSQFDIEGVDVGNAIWAMHSAAETASVDDQLAMVKAMRLFFR